MKLITVTTTSTYYLKTTDTDITIQAGVLATVTVSPPLPYSINNERTFTIKPNQTFNFSLNGKNWIVTSVVTSVFGRTNAVVAQDGDYTASQITNVPSSDIVATNVQDAINEVNGKILVKSVANTSTVNLLVSAEKQLSASFASLNISQFTNDSYYTPTIYTKKTTTTAANTIVETDLFTSPSTLPANFWIAGRDLTLKLRGFHSATGNPSIQIRVYLNSTVVLDTGVVSSGNSTNAYFDIDGSIRHVSSGALGSVIGQGYYSEGGGGLGQFGMVNTIPITIDTTIAQVLQVTIQWGTANPGNTFSCTNGYVLAAYHP